MQGCVFAAGLRLGWERRHSICLGFTSYQNSRSQPGFPNILGAEHGRDPGPSQPPCGVLAGWSRGCWEMMVRWVDKEAVGCFLCSWCLHFMSTPCPWRGWGDFSLLNQLNQSLPPITTGQGEGSLAFKMKVYFGSLGFGVANVL